MHTNRIYVRLLGEGTDVFRPVESDELAGGVYRIRETSDYDPEDEVWEFTPGTLVRCRLEHRNGRDLLIAYVLA